MLKKVAIIILVVGLFISCQDSSIQPENIEDGSFTIEFDQQAEQSLNKISSNDLSKVVVDILNESDSLVYSNKTIALINFNGKYISESISLKPGNYKLSKFLVTNESDSVLFATPVEGSNTAHLVDNPLLISFSINSNETENVVTEVISVFNFSASDFGYATFSFNIVETLNFLISSLIYDEANSSFVLTDANIMISSDTTELYTGKLISGTSNIYLKKDFPEYTITVSKDEYSDVNLNYTQEELLEFNNTPIIVHLYKYDINNFTQVLLHGEGNDNQSIFYDSSPNNYQVQPFGNVITDTDNKVYGISSIYFDGDGDYIEIPYSINNNFGTNDFTMEYWINLTTEKERQDPIVSRDDQIDLSNHWVTSIINGAFHVWFIVDDVAIAGLSTEDLNLETNIWYHFALVRKNNDGYFFLNGNLVKKLNNMFPDIDIRTILPIRIGENNAGFYPFNGYIDEFRLSIGIARWTENFTPHQ